MERQSLIEVVPTWNVKPGSAGRRPTLPLDPQGQPGLCIGCLRSSDKGGVTKRRKRRPDKARDRDPGMRTVVVG